MTNAEATITENAATLTETGRARRAGEGLVDEGCHREEGRAQSQERR